MDKKSHRVTIRRIREDVLTIDVVDTGACAALDQVDSWNDGSKNMLFDFRSDQVQRNEKFKVSIG